MPALNLALEFFDHPKTIRLTAALGEGAELLPIRLWIHTARYHFKDGILGGYTQDELERFMGWKGEKGRAITEISRIGFLDPVEGGFRVHDWQDHAGHFLAYHLKALKMNKIRWKKSGVRGASSKESGKDSSKESQGRAGQGSARRGRAGKKGAASDRPETLAVYGYWSRLLKASARKKDALMWIGRRAENHSFERLIMTITRYKAECNEEDREERYFKDCANFFGEDATFERYLPDEEWFQKYQDKAQAELQGTK